MPRGLVPSNFAILSYKNNGNESGEKHNFRTHTVERPCSYVKYQAIDLSIILQILLAARPKSTVLPSAYLKYRRGAIIFRKNFWPKPKKAFF